MAGILLGAVNDPAWFVSEQVPKEPASAPMVWLFSVRSAYLLGVFGPDKPIVSTLERSPLRLIPDNSE
ncbi:hypothetical protein E4U41_000254 [Claviceps citrina]|nr:hypothetical protein E4U41_000254 [Claviceps citrina]